MKTQAKAIAVPQSTTGIWLSVVTAAFIGIALMAVTGHAQAAALHDAAHDMRHATGFPCH